MTARTALPLLDGNAQPCCAPLARGALDAEEATGLARMFKALGDPTRVRLLSLIAAQPERGPASATSSSRSDCPSRLSPTT
jgi:ArsR family transcriptional regulator